MEVYWNIVIFTVTKTKILETPILEAPIFEVSQYANYIKNPRSCEQGRGSVCGKVAIYYKRYTNTQELKADGYIVIIRDGELVWNFAAI